MWTSRFFYLDLVLLGCLAASPLFAGTKDGGGGNAVVCFERPEDLYLVRAQGGVIRTESGILDRIESIEAYDLVDAKKEIGTPPRTPQIIEIGENEQPLEYATRILWRWDAVNGRMYDFENPGNGSREMDREKILSRLDANEIVYESNGVIQIDDTNPSGTIETDHCTRVTMAVQTNGPRTDSMRLSIDPRLFFHPKHSRLSQGVLLLHELIYSSARMFAGHQTSEHTRALIARMIRVDLTDHALKSLLRNELFGSFYPIRASWRVGATLVKDEGHERRFDDLNPQYTQWISNLHRSLCKIAGNVLPCSKFFEGSRDHTYSFRESLAALKSLQDDSRNHPKVVSQSRDALAKLRRDYFPQRGRYLLNSLMHDYRQSFAPKAKKLFGQAFSDRLEQILQQQDTSGDDYGRYDFTDGLMLRIASPEAKEICDGPAPLAVP
jgi:hypothetical protein